MITPTAANGRNSKEADRKETGDVYERIPRSVVPDRHRVDRDERADDVPDRDRDRSDEQTPDEDRFGARPPQPA